jgi:hypothetical protein
MIRRFVAYFPFTLIVLAFGGMIAAGAYYYVQSAVERLDRNNARIIRTNNDLAQTNHKLAKTLALVTDNGNRGACSIRGALITARSRTKVGLLAAKTAADKAAAQKAIDDYTALIDAQRTVPLTFDCATLIPGGSG